MKILMVLSSGKFPPDARVEREARSLINTGRTLFLMARRVTGQRKRENVNGVQVMRVWMPFQKIKAVSDFIYFFFQRYLIFFNILIACKKHRIDVLHVHDLCYAFATTLAGKCLGIPVIFDMHEHYTCMLKTSFEAAAYRKFKPFAFILLWLLKKEERFACRRAKKLIVVADEHISRVHECGTAVEDITVVTNTEEIEYFTTMPTDLTVTKPNEDDFVILYTGAFCPLRGLETAIQAMPAVLQEMPNARLLLVGDGAIRHELEQLVHDLKIDERVTFAGYQPYSKLPSYIRLCDVGLIPHTSTPHIETTMPNKIFQFMMLAKPVIVSNTKPMMRIVDDAQCGLYFEAQNQDSLAGVILRFANADLRNRLGQNGRKATEEKYNWQETSKNLLETYQKLS